MDGANEMVMNYEMIYTRRQYQLENQEDIMSYTCRLYWKMSTRWIKYYINDEYNSNLKQVTFGAPCIG